VTHGFEPSRDLMMLGDPTEHQFISMNPLFHVSIPTSAKKVRNQPKNKT
jgi:hypothetical protein